MMKMRYTFAATLLTIALGPSAWAAPPEAVKELAPGGTLHAAINYGNPVLARRPASGDEPRGVSAELARELARQLGVAVQFVIFNQAGQVTEALKANPKAWDVAFLAIDPVRAQGIVFSPPYVVIEGAYLVPKASALQTVESVDGAGKRIATTTGSAYDLYLTRALKNAQLVRFKTWDEATAAFEAQHLEALAGVKQPVVAYAATHPDTRVVPGRFMAIEQAVATPLGRTAGAAFLRTFIEQMKASGFVAGALSASGQDKSAVAPAAPPQ
jgi:polar amino acid transport system substrate-binding protein